MSDNNNVLLSMKHITKKFGKLTVLDDMSLDVHEHEIVVLCGPSGGGKSTLLRTVNGLEKINGGEIHYRGEPVSYTHLFHFSGTVGAAQVFQKKNSLDAVFLILLLRHCSRGFSM